MHDIEKIFNQRYDIYKSFKELIELNEESLKYFKEAIQKLDNESDAFAQRYEKEKIMTGFAIPHLLK